MRPENIASMNRQRLVIPKPPIWVAELGKCCFVRSVFDLVSLLFSAILFAFSLSSVEL